jgi:hypothetical protein
MRPIPFFATAEGIVVVAVVAAFTPVSCSTGRPPEQPMTTTIPTASTKGSADAMPTGVPDSSGSDAADEEADVRAPFVDRHGRPVPEEYLNCLRILDYLTDRNSYFGRFEAGKSKNIEARVVADWLDQDGVHFFDTNDPSWSGTMTVREIQKQLASRNGPVFTQLVHLGHIYSESTPSYSHLTFEDVPGGVVVKMAQQYKLTYTTVPQGCLLRKCEYVNVEGE